MGCDSSIVDLFTLILIIYIYLNIFFNLLLKKTNKMSVNRQYNHLSASMNDKYTSNFKKGEICVSVTH